MIKVDRVNVSLGGSPILKDVSFSVSSGTVAGYLGPNGAGKTTTIRLLTGVLTPDSGRVMLGDVCVADDPLEAKRRFGYVPEHGHLYESFTPMEYLLFVGRMHGVEETLLKKRIRALLQFWTLAEDIGRKMNGFSKGQKQKVLLSAAVLHDPPVLLLDEPLTGLDAHAVLQLRAFLRTRAAAGRTVFYSSHLMDAVEKVADRVIVLNKGEIVAQGPPDEVKESVGRDSLEGAFSHLTSTADPDIEAAALEAEAFA